ncbi:peptide chain release factor N(5)-glutamine methyltransferase [Aliikangiella sp. IMCC44359]|uniref:peptide chain release factor N(5)-glutamine methyltransferase n=1 Tax=Aliikangiella sp. IMCC44359 TaxID=3459125 RepID=UPI00403AE4ED
MNVQEALKLAKQKLNGETGLVDGEFLLSKILNQTFTWLKTWPDYELTFEQEKCFHDWLKRRQKGEPVAYITGEQGFWNLLLKTDPSTLIPRADTELLVETALEFLASYQRAKVLDLGTGTGAIALSISYERPHDRVFACDFSSKAVDLAKHNAIKNNLNRVNLFQSNWFDSVEEKAFDLIVSNPPYIAPNDPHLEQGDLIFEPDSALIAVDDGLADIIKIVKQSPEYLCDGGSLMLEHGFEQGQQVRDILQQNGFCCVYTKKDLAQLDRVTVGIYSC